MTGLDTQATEWGARLATVDADERARLVKLAHQKLIADLPEDEVARPPIRSLGDYLDQEIELPPMLVEPGLVAIGALTALVAKGGKGKTAVSLNRLIRWSMGRPLFDQLPELMAPVRPLRVLLIENEGSPGHFQQIMRTIVTHGDNGFTPEQVELARENITIWGNGGWSGLKLDNEENLQLVERACEAIEADIVFVEPFRGLWRGEENSSTEMAVLIDNLSRLANEHECGVMFTHHERKSGQGEGDPLDAARGSAVIGDLCAVMERWLPVKGAAQRELSWAKNRFKEAPAPVRMEFERDRWGYRYVREDEHGRDLLAILDREPSTYFTVAELAEETGEHQGSVRRWANGLVDEEKAKKQRFEGPPAGYRYRTARRADAEDDTLALT